NPVRFLLDGLLGSFRCGPVFGGCPDIDRTREMRAGRTMKLLDPRGVGLVCAAAALIAGATIAGCSNSVDGTAAPNAADLSAYKTYAASSSAAATSSRKAAAQAKAIADNCGQFPVITGVGVSKYNEFVDAHDSNAPDY